MSLDALTYERWVNVAHLVLVTETRDVTGSHMNQIVCGGYNWGIDEEGWIGDIVHKEALARVDASVEPDMSVHTSLTCEEAHLVCREAFEKTLHDLVVAIAEAPHTLYKAEIARRLGFDTKSTPVLEKSHGWVPNNLMKIALSIVPGLRVSSKKAHRYEFVGSLAYELPEPHDFKFTTPSKLEEIVAQVVRDLGFVAKRQGREYLTPGVKRSPWDVVVYETDRILVGMIEVDGEHHYKKDSYFHRKSKLGLDDSWEKRVRIDTTKDELALEASGRECLRIRGSKKQWPIPKLKETLSIWIESIL